MEAMMIDKMQFLMAGVAALSLGAFVPLPVHADDNSQPWLRADDVRTGPPRLEPRLRPDPRHTQISDSAQSASSESSASASASSSASSSVTVTGGQKQGKCTAEATANAQANGVEDSDHDMKVVEGDGCSAKAESSATVKPQSKQSE